MTEASGRPSWWRRWLRWKRPQEYVPVQPDEAAAEEGAQPVVRWGLPHWPHSRRERQLAALQEGYKELLGLVRGIREHLERQQVMQEKLMEVLQQIPASMDNLRSFGELAAQQRELLAALQRQIDAATVSDRQLAESMNQFNQTLAALDQTTRLSGRAVERATSRAIEAEEMLRAAMERSERRFLGMGIVLALLILAVAAIGVATIRAISSPRVFMPTAPVTTPPVEVSPKVVSEEPLGPQQPPAMEAPAAVSAPEPIEVSPPPAQDRPPKPQRSPSRRRTSRQSQPPPTENAP